ncbi:MAG: nicotinamide mononucleotide transporter [Paludibacteraceae bacterium]|nr:nicotinamide mononucleotide transporter [Paludibacteraceae bacterium]
MKNANLWRALGRNTIVSIILFGALLGLLYLAEMIWPELTLLKWSDPAWVVGIPASIIGVAYILTIKDPSNYTGFYAGIIMSILLGVQFMLQKPKPGVDSAFLFFCVFIPFQIKSILNWSKPQKTDAEPFSPEFLKMKGMLLSVLVLILITAVDYLFATWYYGNGLGDAIASKLLGGLLISSSVLANFWLIYRKTDSWIYWFIYSAAGIGLFVLLDNVFSIVLFIFFLVINSMAGIAWIKGTKPENMGWLKGK